MRPNGSIPTRDEIIAYLTSVLTPKQTDLNLRSYVEEATLTLTYNKLINLKKGYFDPDVCFMSDTNKSVATKTQAVYALDQVMAKAIQDLRVPSSAQEASLFGNTYGADSTLIVAVASCSNGCRGLGVDYFRKSENPFIFLDDPNFTESVLSYQANKAIKPAPKSAFYDAGLTSKKIMREDISSDLTNQFSDTTFFEERLQTQQYPQYWLDGLIMLAIRMASLQSDAEPANFTSAINYVNPQSNAALIAESLTKLKIVFGIFLRPSVSQTFNDPKQSLGLYIYEVLKHHMFAGSDTVTIEFINLCVEKMKEINSLVTVWRNGGSRGSFTLTDSNISDMFKPKSNSTGGLSSGIINYFKTYITRRPTLGTAPTDSIPGLDPYSFFVSLAWLYTNFGFGYGAHGTPTRIFTYNPTYKQKGEPLLKEYSQWLVNRFGGSSFYAPRPNWQDLVPTESFKRAQFFVPTANIGTSYDFLLDYLGQDGVVIKGRAGEVLPEEPVGSEITLFEARQQPTLVAQSQKSSKSNLVWWVLGVGVVGGGGYYLWKRNKSK